MNELDGRIDPVAGRRRLLQGLGIGGVAVLGGLAGGAAASLIGGEFSSQRLEVEVACLGDTWRDSPVRNPSDDADFRAPFLVEGWVYPAGTVPPTGFVPREEGSIGRWFCRGWIIIDNDRFEPHVLSHQEFVFGSISDERLFPPDTLSTSGLEGSITDQSIPRSVVGGSGIYRGATGGVLQVPLGTNTTVIDDGTGDSALNFTEIFDLQLLK